MYLLLFAYVQKQRIVICERVASSVGGRRGDIWISIDIFLYICIYVQKQGIVICEREASLVGGWENIWISIDSFFSWKKKKCNLRKRGKLGGWKAGKIIQFPFPRLILCHTGRPVEKASLLWWGIFYHFYFFSLLKMIICWLWWGRFISGLVNSKLGTW